MPAGSRSAISTAAPFVGLLGETETTSLTGNFVFRLNDKAELFADALWAKIDCQRNLPAQSAAHQLHGNRRGIRPIRASIAVLLLRTTNPNYQIAANYLNANGLGALVGQDLGITARVFDFGPRTEENTSTQTRIVGGVRGDFMEQSYNIALAYNQNKLDGKVTDGYFSQVGFRAGDPGARQRLESLVADAVAGLQGCHRAGQVRRRDAQRQVAPIQSSMRRLPATCVQLPAGMMQYAAGYQYRSEKLEQTPSAALVQRRHRRPGRRAQAA